MNYLLHITLKLILINLTPFEIILSMIILYCDNYAITGYPTGNVLPLSLEDAWETRKFHDVPLVFGKFC